MDDELRTPEYSEILIFNPRTESSDWRTFESARAEEPKFPLYESTGPVCLPI